MAWPLATSPARVERRALHRAVHPRHTGGAPGPSKQPKARSYHILARWMMGGPGARQPCAAVAPTPSRRQQHVLSASDAPCAMTMPDGDASSASVYAQHIPNACSEKIIHLKVPIAVQWRPDRWDTGDIAD